jgi:hypothetical protein
MLNVMWLSVVSTGLVSGQQANDTTDSKLLFKITNIFKSKSFILK